MFNKKTLATFSLAVALSGGCTMVKHNDMAYLQAYLDSTTTSLEAATQKAASLNEALSRKLQQAEDERQALQAELKSQQGQLRKMKKALAKARRKTHQASISLHQQAEDLKLRQEQLEVNIQRLAFNLSRQLEHLATSGDFSQLDVMQEETETPSALSTSSTVPEASSPE